MNSKPTLTAYATKPSLTRRDFLNWASHGIGATAVLSLLKSGGFLANVEGATAPSVSHFPAKSKRVIHLCMCGGVSHIDTFDYKPELTRFHGKSLPTDETPETFFGKVGLLRKNDWSFQKRGQSGLWISELFPHISSVADELTVIRSMVADTANHTPATFQQNTGFRLNGFPVMGAWISYGLGCETEDLPAYVVLPDIRGLPAAGTINWSNGFLPAQHQGVAFQSKGPAIRDLFPSRAASMKADRESRRFLKKMNERHLERIGAEDLLIARLRSYELAARMQLSVPDVTDLSKETPATLQSYGFNHEETKDFGKRCLLARRMLEKGVRFVQIFGGGSFGSPRINWDGHEDMLKNHTREAFRVDQPIAALIRDLKQRGLLEDTLVLFTSEFGRTPFSESAADKVGTGRDHNMYGFSVWMAGAGLRAGMAYGNTDEVGWKSVENPVAWHDFHATVLHLLGIDHEKLTLYHNGIERRLTNVHGDIIRKILKDPT